MIKPVNFALILSLLAFSLSAGCAYRFGLGERALPGGYRQVAIPVFKNKSPEVGIEAGFTNALIRRFARSQVADVTSKELAPLVLEGTIDTVSVAAGAPQTPGQLTTLPDSTVLNTQYTIVVSSTLVLKRQSDEKILWQGNFRSERVYPAPRIGAPVLNSANTTYNQSAKINAITALAEEMMAEAHNRVTESF